VHGLEAPGDAHDLLGVGVRDNPPGRTAHLVLRVRAPRLAVREGVLDGDLPLVYAARAATHVHRAADLPLLVAALRLDDNDAPSVTSFGPFGKELAGQGVALPDAVDQVAEAMRRVTADGKATDGKAPDGRARTKGELSGAVTPLVDRRFAPWCEGCGVHHVHDGLWRYATLQAGLRLVHDPSPSGFRLVRTRTGTAGAEVRADRDESRRTLTGRFLRLFGPATPDHVGSWLGLSRAAAHRWWRLVEEELVPVSVDGAARWIRAEDLDLLCDAPRPRKTLLLPPYDPITELADRDLLIPDKAVRRQVWRPTANPGVVLVRGELAGTWRQRTRRDRLELTVTMNGTHRRPPIEADAAALATALGLAGVTVSWRAA
jgi:hypothetical protein